MNQKLILTIIILCMVSTRSYCLDKKTWGQSLTESINKASDKLKSLGYKSAEKYEKFNDYMGKFGRRLYEAEKSMGLRPKEILRTEEIPYVDPSYDYELRKYKDFKAFEKVADKYTPPEKIKVEIEQGFDPNRVFNAEGYLLDYKPHPVAGPSGIYYKGPRLDRLFNAERAKKVIEDEGLNLITIPQKYIYKTKYGWHVFAEPIKPGNQGPLTLDEVKQLVTFMKKTHYIDLHNENLIRTADGKIAIIDTENRSFSPTKYHKDIYKDLIHPTGYFRLYNTFTPEARKWMENEDAIAHEIYSKERSLPRARQYDPKGIDFKRAYRASTHYWEKPNTRYWE